MMKRTHDIDSLFAASREAEPYLDGGAFTSAVMAQLPRPRELPAWVKNSLLLGATVLGSVPAAINLPIRELIMEIVPTVQTIPFMAMAAVVMFTMSYGVAWLAQKDIV